MTRRLRPATALALVALIGAGCGSGAPSETGAAGSTGTATTSGGGSSSGSGGGKSATGQAKAVKFSECIRGHGVPHFPDPDAKGEFNFGVDVTPTVWRKAVDACKALQPPGSLSSERNPKQQTAGLKLARCIRDNGVRDFPDPVDGEPLINTYKIPSSNRAGGMTILNAAIQKCRPILDQAAAGQ